MFEEKGVSYYGVYDPESAAGDFAAMRESGLNAVLIGVSEFDYWFWRKALGEVLREASAQGLSSYVDLWGWGKVFGGEPGSIYVEKNPEDLQKSWDGSVIPAACMNSGFRKFVLESLQDICENYEFDGIFVDEPHYGRAGEAWGCCCDRCEGLFEERFGRRLERGLSEDVVRFRESSMLQFLSDIVDVVKAAGKGVTICMLPFEGEKRRLVGAPDWDEIRALDADVLATDPYWITFGEDMATFVKRHVVRLLKACHGAGKKAQVWVQLFNVPEGREEELAKGIDFIEKLEVDGKGVDSLFGWPFLAGKNSILTSDRPELVWKKFLTALES
jgi:hypothetical protein